MEHACRARDGPILYPESEATLRTLAFALLDRLAAAEQAAATLVRRSPNEASVVRLAAAALRQFELCAGRQQRRATAWTGPRAARA